MRTYAQGGEKEEERDERGKQEESGGRSADSWPSRGGAREREPGGAGAGGYLSEEAGDHLLEGVLVHLLHVHRDPHPARPPRRSERRASRTLRGPQASKRWGPKGRGFSFSPPFSNFRNFIVHSEKQTGGQTPAPFRQRPVWEPRGRGGAGSPALPGHACSFSAPEPPRGILQPWTLGLVL